MGKQKTKKHHSKPHGGATSYANQLAQRRAMKQALERSAMTKAVRMTANIEIQRMSWLTVLAAAEAFGIGPKRMQRDFFPALQRNADWLEEMRRENGDVYAFEKLRQVAEQASGIPIKHFYDPDPAAALAEEERREKEY